jgi:membrane associated rhomboid family serine protease
MGMGRQSTARQEGPMTDNLNAPPLNPLPLVVWVIALPIIAMEVVLSLGARGLVGGPEAIGWRLDAMERFAFSPDILRYMWSTGDYSLANLARLVTYPVVHLGFTHALMVVVILLALGKMVGEVFRPWAVLVIFFGAAAAAAVVFTLLPMTSAPLIGGYPAVYGLIGAFTFLLWVRLAAVGANRYRAFTLIGFLMGIQLLFGALFGGNWEWVADLTGFAAGFVLSFLVSPGGPMRVLALIRQR